MSINLQKVQWDNPESIDPTKVKWDAPALVDLNKVQWDEPEPSKWGAVIEGMKVKHLTAHKRALPAIEPRYFH